MQSRLTRIFDPANDYAIKLGSPHAGGVQSVSQPEPPLLSRKSKQKTLPNSAGGAIDATQNRLVSWQA